MTDSTSTATTKTCAHSGCSCAAPKDYPYCSAECANTDKVTSESVICPCPHSGCRTDES